MTCNHCDNPVDFTKLKPFHRMCFRGMCHACEAMTLEERIDRFPKVRALAEQLGQLGLGLNSPLAPGFMTKNK